MKKLRLEERLEGLQWSPWQWVLAVLALMMIVYGAARFIQWALK